MVCVSNNLLYSVCGTFLQARVWRPTAHEF